MPSLRVDDHQTGPLNPGREKVNRPVVGGSHRMLEGLEFETELKSDSAALNGLVASVLDTVGDFFRAAA